MGEKDVRLSGYFNDDLLHLDGLWARQLYCGPLPHAATPEKLLAEVAERGKTKSAA